MIEAMYDINRWLRYNTSYQVRIDLLGNMDDGGWVTVSLLKDGKRVKHWTAMDVGELSLTLQEVFAFLETVSSHDHT